MTKSDLAACLYDKTGLPKRDAVDLVEDLIGLMKATLVAGDRLRIAGFGSFNIRDKSPRRGRNPQTGEEIVLAGRRVLTFKPSPVLRERLNGLPAL